jgi:endonuclease/exonuclease/phosphatase family metal-dependent hydrolase
VVVGPGRKQRVENRTVNPIESSALALAHAGIIRTAPLARGYPVGPMAGRSFRLLTLNTLWQPAARARLEAIAPELDGSGIDFICLQEVVLRRNVRLLEQRLTAYQPAVSRPFALWATGGLVSFTRHPIEKSSYEVFTRRGEWWNIGAADRLLRKGFLIAWLRAGDLEVIVVNTHLLANYDQDWSLGNRYVRHQEAELDQLAAAIDRLDRDALLIVAGDFNVPQDSPMFEGFTAGCGLRNASGPGVPLPTWRPPGSKEGTIVIDHVLYREPSGRPIEVKSRLRFDSMVRLKDGGMAYASDHLAIEADFDLDPSKA